MQEGAADDYGIRWDARIKKGTPARVEPSIRGCQG